MNLKQATFWSGIIFLVLGIVTWIPFDAASKTFSLSGNFIATGLAVLLVSLLVKVK